MRKSDEQYGLWYELAGRHDFEGVLGIGLWGWFRSAIYFYQSGSWVSSLLTLPC